MNTKNIFLTSENPESQQYCESLHTALSKWISYDELYDIVSDTVHGDGIQELLNDIKNITTTKDIPWDQYWLHIRQKIYEAITDEEILEQLIHRFYATQDIHAIMTRVEKELGINDERYSQIRNTQNTQRTQSAIFKQFVRDILNALHKKDNTERLVYVQAAQKWLTANLLNAQIEYI